MRLIAIVILAAVLAPIAIGVTVRGIIIPVPPAVATFTPSQDAYVDSANPNTNFDISSIRIDKIAPSKEFWIQWNVVGIPPLSVVTNAQIIFFAATVNVNPGFFYEASDPLSSWSETTITWNNKPSDSCCDKAQMGLVNSNAGGFVSYPITAKAAGWVAGSTNVGLRFFSQSAGTGAVVFLSRDDGRPDAFPLLRIEYLPPTATVYPAYYCSGGPCETSVASGSGLPAYLFSVFYSENNGTLRQAVRPDFIPTNITTWFRLQVKDFLGNVLYDSNKSVTATQFPWLVPIPYGILQAYNMRDGITTFSIKPAGGLAMNIDLVPRAWWAIPLKSGIKYWLNFTLLDSSFNILGTVNVVQVMGTKLSYIVNGTSLTQISANVNNNWFRSNETFAVTAGTGNILLAPHGLNVFEAYYTVNFGIASLPITLWLFGVIAAILGWSAWAFAYRGKLSRRIRSWPRRAKLFAGFALLPLSSTLLITFIVHLAGGSVFIPIPWAPITL